MTATILLITIPLVAIAFALWAGVPLWMIFRHPDRHPHETRTIPEYLTHSPHRERVLPAALRAQMEPSRTHERERERELVGASSR